MYSLQIFQIKYTTKRIIAEFKQISTTKIALDFLERTIVTNVKNVHQYVCAGVAVKIAALVIYTTIFILHKRVSAPVF